MAAYSDAKTRIHQALVSDPRKKPFLDLYATNPNEFFNTFARLIEKLSMDKVNTGKDEKIRSMVMFSTPRTLI